jgi:hypothetical protein
MCEYKRTSKRFGGDCSVGGLVHLPSGGGGMAWLASGYGVAGRSAAEDEDRIVLRIGDRWPVV